jgi:hypothetical protein
LVAQVRVVVEEVLQLVHALLAPHPRERGAARVAELRGLIVAPEADDSRHEVVASNPVAAFGAAPERARSALRAPLLHFCAPLRVSGDDVATRADDRGHVLA